MVGSGNKIVFERILTDGTGSLRVVIPLELARTLSFHAGETVKIWLEKDRILIQRKVEQIGVKH